MHAKLAYQCYSCSASRHKSHIGSIFTIGEGSIVNSSTKKNCNAHSSTKSEPNSAAENMSKVELGKKFLEAQNCKIKLSAIFQNNESAIKLF